MDAQVLKSETYEYIMLHGKRGLKLQIKVRLLRLFRITCVGLCNNKGPFKSKRHRSVRICDLQVVYF